MTEEKFVADQTSVESSNESTRFMRRGQLLDGISSKRPWRWRQRWH